MSFTKTTEQDSKYNDLEQMNTIELLKNINNEDKTVALSVEKALPQITNLTNQIVDKLKNGGRIFYLGAGTSGRLGILDASECPPTFGVPHELVVGLIAGGDIAIRKAVENAEDSKTQGWLDLKEHHITDKDIVIGIAASGTTPYVIAALEMCNNQHIITGCITCNKNSPLSKASKFPIEVVVGPEFVTGSSRMKAGTAQKMVLNMLTTSSMILLGKIKGNKMVDMQLSNHKLVNRGELMLVKELQIDQKTASLLLKKHKNVRTAIIKYQNEH
jgi:N-acetylmuramic acid 6-phosphate etherase